MRAIQLAFVIFLGAMWGGQFTAARAADPPRSTVCLTDPSPFCETYRRLHGIPDPVR